MAGTVAPFWYHQFFDNNGDPLAAGTIETFLAGTSTPVATYQDAALSVSNGTTITLDSAGRAKIFLAALSYKFVVKNSAGSTITTLDNVQSMGLTALSSSLNDAVNGRLTLTSGTPVTTGNVTAATTVRFAPYGGNRITLYDGTAWGIYNFTELSIALGSDAADTNNDVFAYVSSGAAAIERLAWTNATTRATALTTQDGVLVKSGDATRRYLGTYRTTGTIGQTEDSIAKRFVWNYYNRVARALRVLEATDSWTYTLAAYRQANGSTANQVAVIVGWREALMELEVVAHNSNGNAGTVSTAVSIGEDSTTASMTDVVGRFSGTIASSGATLQLRASVRAYPDVGYRYYAWLEFSAATNTTTWYGDQGGVVTQSGMNGSIEG